MRNTSYNVRLESNLAGDVATKNGIKYATALKRISKGWDIEKAVTHIREEYSNHKGVTFDKSRNKWKAFVNVNGNQKSVRTDSESDAITALSKLRRQYGIR